MTTINIEIIEALDNNLIAQLKKLYDLNHWSQNRSIERIKIALKNSTLTIGIIQNNQLLGFGRLLSDQVFRATIYDIMIQNDRQNQGLGKQLINYMLNHNTLKNVTQIDICCRPEKESFYKKWHFKKNLQNTNYLRLIRKQTTPIE